jgi:predicted dehydrogenase
MNFLDQWIKIPTHQEIDNAFKTQWELFLRHIVNDEPFPWNLLEGAKGVQLAEKGIESWRTRAWVDLPELKAIQREPA